MGAICAARVRTIRGLLAAACLLILGGVSFAKQVNLEYDLTIVDNPAELRGMMKSDALPAASSTTTAKAIIGMGESHLSVQKGARKNLYDLAAARIFRIDTAGSRYIEESLYADVGFRVAELQNRLMLGEAMLKAKIDKSKIPFDRFQVESVLAVEWPGPEAAADAPEIKTEEAAGVWTFLHDGQWAVRFIPSKLALPPPAAARFAQFLAYECTLHPKIRHKILEVGKIPEKLEYHAVDAPHACTTTWVFRKMTESDKDDLPLGKEFKPAATADGPFAEILAELKTRKTPPARTEAQAFVKAAVADKKYLDAMLAAVECHLQYGDAAAGSLLKEVQPFAQADPPLRAYLEALVASNDAKTAAQALARLDSIDRSGLAKGYVIDIARAVTLTTLGRRKEAIALYMLALKHNPFIAGAYKDLGDLYAASYQMPLAWKCWDTGRAISPNLPMLQEVNQREQWLRQTLPDFFLAPKAK